MLYLRYRTPPSCKFPGWPSVKEFPGIPVPPEEVESALAATKEFASEFNRRHFYPNRTVHYDTKAFLASKELRQRIRSLFLLKMKKEKMKKEKKERKPKEKKIETVKEKKLKTVKEKKEKKVKVSKPKKDAKMKHLSRPKLVLKSKSSSVKGVKSKTNTNRLKKSKSKKEKRINKKTSRKIRKEVDEAVERAKNDWKRYQHRSPEALKELGNVDNNNDNLLDLPEEVSISAGRSGYHGQMFEPLADIDAIAEDDDEDDGLEEWQLVDMVEDMQRQSLGTTLCPVTQNLAPREGNSCRLEGSGGRNENRKELPGEEVLEMVNFLLDLRKSPEAATQPIFPRRKKAVRKQKRKKLTLEDLRDLSDDDEDFKGPSIKKDRAKMEERRSRRLAIEKIKQDSGEYYSEEESAQLFGN